MTAIHSMLPGGTVTLSMQPTLPIGKIVRGKNPREYFDPAEVAELGPVNTFSVHLRQARS